MLVLSRKLGERIKVGDDIWITVVDIDRGKIRLGIDAPRQVNIMREELIDGPPRSATNANQGEETPGQPGQTSAVNGRATT